MANFFDRFDAAPQASQAQPGARNFFDQFEEPAATGPTRTEKTPDGRTIVRMDMSNTKPDRGVADAAARGVAQGFTANFSDEIRGLVEASGANPDDPASLTALISGALKYWGGDKEAKKRYDEAVKRERELNKTAEEQHPYASLAGEVGGAVVLPLGAGAGAATLPGRMAAGAGTGAVIGGAAGAGEGQGAADSVSRGLVGAAAGGALGAAAPAVIEGAVRGARAVAQPIANAVRGVRNVDDEAARRIATALERDIQADPAAVNRLTAPEFAASIQSGGPATIMDIGGDTTRALARSAANTSPEGRGTLSRAIDDRFEGQADRVTGWLRRTFHFPDAGAQQEAIQQTAKNVNNVAYARATSDPRAQSMWDGTFEQLTGSPDVQDAILKAVRTGKNKAAAGGFRPESPFEMGHMGPKIVDGVMVLRPNVTPTLRFWDAVKRNLDDKIGELTRAGSKNNASDLIELKNQLVSHLDAAVPSYAQARAGAAHFFGAQDALEAGQNFVSRNMSSGEARRALSQMSPTERQLFQDGFVSKFTDTLNQVGDRRSVLNKIADSPAAREKLRIALGPQRADELEAGLRVEGVMDLARGAVQGNSTTARQLAELGLAGGAFGFSGGVSNPLDPGAVMNAAIVYGALRGKNAINERLSRRVAEMLVSQDPQVLLRGIRTVTQNRQMFNALRSADRGLARIGGEQAPVAPSLQAVGVSRAEDQPNVPRPPGQ